MTALQNAQPNYVYLMIGSNDSMSDIPTTLSNELSLISYIDSNDSSLQRIFVEPPPSYPSASNGSVPNAYDTYAIDLGNALATAPLQRIYDFRRFALRTDQRRFQRGHAAPDRRGLRDYRHRFL